MALRAMTTADSIDYVSDLDPCKKVTKTFNDASDPSKGFVESWEIEEGATTFKLKPLDVFLMGFIYDQSQYFGQSVEGMKIHTRVNQTNIESVRFGLAGLTNFKKPDGSAVVYSTVKEIVNGREYQAVTEDVIKALGIKLIQELAEQVKKISEVTPEESKKSGALSSPSVS